MDSELFYNTPVFDKDPKYCDCENCNGSGHVCDMIEDVPTKEDCPECEGSGMLEIE